MSEFIQSFLPLAGLIVAGIVWAVREEGKRAALEARIDARLDSLEQRHAQGDARLLGLEARILSQLNRIEDKLDRKVDK
jgi:CHASE1-domain containing sensor protein